MKAPEDQQVKRGTKTRETTVTSRSTMGVNEKASLAQSSKKDPPNSTNDDLSNYADADLKWEFEKHLDSYRFFLDLGLKAVGLFYVVVGGILTIYFAKEPSKNHEVVKFLLWAPFIMSLILGFSFLGGGGLWRKATKKIIPIAKKLKMRTIPDVELLTWLLWIFGLSFLATGGALVWLIWRLT